jgi:MurNAc alpha-1-phosphate uridylyltransferase
MYPVAILAGGYAKRLHPLTETIPKSLVEVAGKPFISWQLRYLKKQQVDRVVLCTGHLGRMIEEVIRDGRDFALDVQYSRDGPAPLGTGGAIKNALPLLGERFFVLYGDSLLPINFSAVQKFFEEKQSSALMTVFKNTNQWDRSNVLFKDGELKEYNKRSPSPDMQHIDYGLAAIAADVLSKYRLTDSFDLADLYEQLSVDKMLHGYEVNERFYEIGSHQGLRETEDFLLSWDSR